MNKYIFNNSDYNNELLRLQCLERAFDENSKRLLKSAGLKKSHKCLEVGAGAGSILKYMAEQVQESGLVVAVDKDISFLNNVKDNPNIRIIKGLIEDIEFTEKFDLIHIRYVLIHNDNSADLLVKLAKLLKKSGKLIIEEPDFTKAKWLDHKYRTSAQRVNDAICSMFKSLSLNPAYGSDMIFDLEKTELFIESMEENLHFARGNNDIAKTMQRSAQRLKEKYLATKECTEEDFMQYIKATKDPQSMAIYYSTISIIASLTY